MRIDGALILISVFTSAAALAQSGHALPHRDPSADASRALVMIGRADAVQRGALHSPEVGVASAPRAAAALAEDRATSFVRPPHLSVFGGYRARAPVQGPELNVTLTQDIALRGVGDARTEAAAKLRQSIRADVARARLDGALRGVIAWSNALESKEVLRLRTDALTQVEAIAKSTRARVGSGVGQPRELALAEGDVGSSQAQRFDAEGALVEAYVELRYALGLPPDEAVDVSGDIYATDERTLDRAQAIRATTEHPALQTARARTEVAEREVTLARAQLGPFASIGGSYSRESTGEQIFGAVVGIPLIVVDPSRYEQARLRTYADTARASAHRLETELQRDVRLALHDREHWREVREALRTRAIGPLREALRLAMKEYEVGTQDVSMILLARQRLIIAEEQMARASGALLRADAHLAYLTGGLRIDTKDEG